MARESRRSYNYHYHKADIVREMTDRELEMFDPDRQQFDLLNDPVKANEDHLNDLDAGGYTDASATELQSGGEKRNGLYRPAMVQVTRPTPISQQLLRANPIAALRLKVAETPINYTGRPL